MIVSTTVSLHGALVEALGRDIVGGQIKPGDALAPEVLGKAHGISRPVVREAVRTLEGKGLVRAKPGVGTRVRPVAAWNLLDPDVLRWRTTNPVGEQLDLDIAAFLGHMRGLGTELAGNALYDALMSNLTSGSVAADHASGAGA